LYAAVGLTLLVWPTRLPVFAGVLDKAYQMFARNRLRWTGRCAESGGTCRVGPSGSESDAGRST
jgi:predicted DCC family thiol-disulfide oxidoreductase YuxK